MRAVTDLLQTAAFMRWVLLVALIAIASCGEPPPPAPSAVITMSPTSVCVGDAFTTPIHLDATSSAQTLTLVYVRPDPDAGPLQFTWSFSGSAIQIDDGDTSSDSLTLRMQGDRPLHVTLRVQNASGGVTEALSTVSITPRDSTGQCPLPPP